MIKRSAIAAIMETLGAVEHEDGVHLVFPATTGLPIQESTTETPDDPANGVPLSGCGALFLHNGKLYTRAVENGEVSAIIDSKQNAEVAGNQAFVGHDEGKPVNTGAPYVKRWLHAAVRLLDGRVLIAGGLHTEPFVSETQSSCEIYDPETGEFTSTGSMNVARQRHALVLLNDGTVLAIGGQSSNDSADALNSSEIFNPGGGYWTPSGDMSTTYTDVKAVKLDDGGSVLIVNNRRSGSPDVTSELFVEGTWTVQDDLPVERTAFALVALAGGDALLCGGGDSGTASNAAYVFSGGAWTAVGNMVAARLGHSVIALESGNVLIVGGVSGGSNLSSCEIYSVTGETFASTGALPGGVSDPNLALLSSGNVLALMGDGAIGAAVIHAEFNGTTWASVDEPLVQRNNATMTLLDDDICLIVGGVPNGGSSNDLPDYCELYGVPTNVGTLTSDVGVTLNDTPEPFPPLAGIKLVNVGGIFKLQFPDGTTNAIVTETDDQTISGDKDHTGEIKANGVTLVEPAGVVKDYAGVTLPAGYLWCDGAAVSRTTYAALFAAIGTLYGAGDASTTFNVPDCRGRVSIGANSADTPYVGTTDDSRVIREVAAVGGAETTANAVTVDGDTAVPNSLQPWIVFPRIIKY